MTLWFVVAGEASAATSVCPGSPRDPFHADVSGIDLDESLFDFDGLASPSLSPSVHDRSQGHGVHHDCDLHALT